MTHRLGFMSWAASALALVAVTSCGSGSDPKPAPTTSPTATNTSPAVETTSPSPPSPSEAAAAQATALVTRYFAVLDSVRKSASVPTSRLSSVAVSTQLAALKHLVNRERSQGQHQTGDTAVAETKVQAINLDNSDPGSGRIPTVTIDVCWDVRNVDVVDKNGKSVVSPSRPDVGWVRYTVANYHWTKNPSGAWRVASGQELKQTPCSPA